MLKAKLFSAGWDEKESNCILEYIYSAAEFFDSMVTTITKAKKKNNVHIANLWFYCWSQMAFLKMNFNGQARKNVFLYLCNWSVWNMIRKIHRIIGYILFSVNHWASAVNIAAFGNLDLYPTFAQNMRNCLGSWMIYDTGYLCCALRKGFLFCRSWVLT